MKFLVVRLRKGKDKALTLHDEGVPGFTGQGWSSHETALVVKWLLDQPDVWDQAMSLAKKYRDNPHTVADSLHEKLVPRSELVQIADEGFDATKVNWLEIAHELIERVDDPQTIHKDAIQGADEDTKGEQAPNFQEIPDTPLVSEPDNFPDSGVDPKVYEGLRLGSGIIVVEPDSGGKLWLEIPSNEKSKGKFSIPKGGLAPGYTVQQNAHAELWEETGLLAKIVDWVGDFAGTRAYTRLYLGVRAGGHPEHQGTETTGDVLVAPTAAEKDLVKKKYHDMLAATLSCPTYRKLARGSAPVTKAAWEEIQRAGSFSEVLAVLRKNDWENQPRDNRGRFGSGGGGNRAGSANHTFEVQAAVQKIIAGKGSMSDFKIVQHQGNGKGIPPHTMVGAAKGVLGPKTSAYIKSGLEAKGYNVAEKYGHLKVYNSVAVKPETPKPAAEEAKPVTQLEAKPSVQDSAKSGWSKVAAFWAGKTIAGKPASAHFAASNVENWDAKSKTAWGKGLNNPATVNKYGLTEAEKSAMALHLAGKIGIGGGTQEAPGENPLIASALNKIDSYAATFHDGSTMHSVHEMLSGGDAGVKQWLGLAATNLKAYGSGKIPAWFQDAGVTLEEASALGRYADKVGVGGPQATSTASDTQSLSLFDKAGIDAASFNDPKVAASTKEYLQAAALMGKGSFGGKLSPDETQQLLDYVSHMGAPGPPTAAEAVGDTKALLQSANDKLEQLNNSSLPHILSGNDPAGPEHAQAMLDYAALDVGNTFTYGLTEAEVRAVKNELQNISNGGKAVLAGGTPAAPASPSATEEPAAPLTFDTYSATGPIQDALSAAGQQPYAYKVQVGDNHVKVYPTKYGSAVSDKVAAASLVASLKQQGIYAKVSYGHAKVPVLAGTGKLVVGGKHFEGSAAGTMSIGKPVGAGKPASAKIPSAALTPEKEALVQSALGKLNKFGKVGANIGLMLQGKGSASHQSGGGGFSPEQIQSHVAGVLSGSESGTANEMQAFNSLSSDEKQALGEKVAAMKPVLEAKAAASAAKDLKQLQVGSGGEKDFKGDAKKGNAYSALVGKAWRSTWTQEEHQAVQAYKGWSTASENIRSAFQDGKPLSAGQVKTINGLKGMLDRYVQPEPVTLYRWVDTVSNSASWLDSSKVANYKAGDTFMEPGFGSTAIRDNSYGNSRNTLMRIHVPKGYQGIGPVESSGESEWIHQMATQFRVLGVSTGYGGRRVLDVEPTYSLGTMHGAPPFTTESLDKTNIPTDAQIESFNATQTESGNATEIESGNATVGATR